MTDSAPSMSDSTGTDDEQASELTVSSIGIVEPEPQDLPDSQGTKEVVPPSMEQGTTQPMESRQSPELRAQLLARAEA